LVFEAGRGMKPLRMWMYLLIGILRLAATALAR